MNKKNAIAPETKDFTRIRGLFLRDSSLTPYVFAVNMAQSITTYEKALRRGRAAEQLGYDKIADVFFRRASELRG